MKKLVALALTIILTGCSIDDEGSNTVYELAPITSYDLPEAFELGETYEVKVNYQLPSDCHVFQTVDARREGNAPTERNKIYISIVSSVMDTNNCTDDVAGPTGSGKFMITIDEEEDYTFYFWTGGDTEGADYEEVIVPVLE